MWSLPRGQPFIDVYVTVTWEKSQISYLVPLKQTTEESLLFYTMVFMQTTPSWVQRCRRCHAGYRSLSWCWKKDIWVSTLCTSETSSDAFQSDLFCLVFEGLSFITLMLGHVRRKKAFIVLIAKFQQRTMIHIFSVTASRWGLITCLLCNFAGLVLA